MDLIYNLLFSYREFLTKGAKRLSKVTRAQYVFRLESLLKGQSITEPMGNFDMSKVIDNLAKIKFKNHFSQSKNALLKFCEFHNIILDDKQLKAIKDLEANTRKQYKKPKNLDFKEVSIKINRLKNVKLKLSYLTLINTGLRVSELAQITAEGTAITENDISFFFIAKGGKNDSVTLYKNDDKKLYDDLVKLINDTKPLKKYFIQRFIYRRKQKT